MQKYYIPSRFIEGDGVNFSGESIDMVKYTDAEALNARLVEALEYYADPETWRSDDDGISSATEDEGEVARSVL